MDDGSQNRGKTQILHLHLADESDLQMREFTLFLAI